MTIILLTYIPFILSLLIGYGILGLFRDRLALGAGLRFILAGGLGFGLSGQITFLSFALCGQWHAPLLISLHVLLAMVLISWNMFIRVRTKTLTSPLHRVQWKSFWPAPVLICVAIPLWYQCHFYAFGGWDAWSTWNLKAKIMLLNGPQWTNLFDPLLWRSSPQYPLLLPSINVWGWTMVGKPVTNIPVFTTFSLTFLTLGLMVAGLKRLTGSSWAIFTALVLLTQPFYTKMALSQYCDMVLAYYLLASMACMIIARKENNPAFALLAGIFVGILSFTKNEGLAAALLLGGLSLPYFMWKNNGTIRTSLIKQFIFGALIAFIPSGIFYIFFKPESQTFINGLLSTDNPVTLLRLQTILGFYILEMLAPLWNIFALIKQSDEFIQVVSKWHGLWVMLIAALALTKGRCFNRITILMPAFLVLYGCIIITYYMINTYFPIEWWLQVSLARIISAALPVLLFWTFYALWQEKK